MLGNDSWALWIASEQLLVRRQTTTRLVCKPIVVCTQNHYWSDGKPLLLIRSLLIDFLL